MKTLQGVGCSESGPLDADTVVDEEVDADDNCEGDDEHHPILVLFDCETT